MAYIRREICVSKSIELACSGKEIYFCFTLYSRTNSKYKPPRGGGGAYIGGGDLPGGVLGYVFGGLIHGGASFRNFTVCIQER